MGRRRRRRRRRRRCRRREQRTRVRRAELVAARVEDDHDVLMVGAALEAALPGVVERPVE